jgi:hypothetical protein
LSFNTHGRTSIRPPASTSPVLAIGRRVFTNCAGDRDGSVALMDENDHLAQARVPDGIEVEVLAWRPRGSSGTRYRVRVADASPHGGVDGWLHASNLRTTVACPPPAAVASSLSSAPLSRPFGQRR